MRRRGNVVEPGRAPRWAALMVLVAALTLPNPAEAGLQETFEAGNEAFGLGNYEEAVRAYEELVELGVWDADVFYNLGTSYGRQGRFGPAILNLERALLLDPGHVEARDNLAALRRGLARQRTSAGEDADLDPPRSFWLNLLQRVSPAQVSLPFLICWLGLFVVVGIRRVTRREIARLVLLILALLLGASALVGGTLVVSKAYYDAGVHEAIAIRAERAILRQGPGERFRRTETVREGDRLRVLDREGDWLHLRDAAGREGWGQTAHFGELRPHD